MQARSQPVSCHSINCNHAVVNEATSTPADQDQGLHGHPNAREFAGALLPPQIEGRKSDRRGAAHPGGFVQRAVPDERDDAADRSCAVRPPLHGSPLEHQLAVDPDPELSVRLAGAIEAELLIDADPAPAGQRALAALDDRPAPGSGRQLENGLDRAVRAPAGACGEPAAVSGRSRSSVSAPPKRPGRKPPPPNSKSLGSQTL